MSSIRQVIFWIHLCLGITGGIVIFIMCVTGAALSFEKNIIDLVEREQRYVEPGDRRLAHSQVLNAVLEAKPGSRPTAMVVQSDPHAAVAVSLGRDGQVFVDPTLPLSPAKGTLR
jgi:uncharacterized iron-regulated membrane protein